MAHLASHDTVAAQLVKGIPPRSSTSTGAGWNGKPFSVEGFNEWVVERRAGLPTRDVLVTWGKAADAFLAYAGLLSEDDWEKKRFPWLAGEIAARYLIQSRVVEWWIHGEDMRATNGLGPEYQHWPIYMTIDMGVRMLPWALGQAGLDLTGYSVQIDVEGAGEGSWHWGLGAGEVPPADKQPDATIVGRAPSSASWRRGVSRPWTRSRPGTSSSVSTRSSASPSCVTSAPSSEGTGSRVRSYPFREQKVCRFSAWRCRRSSTPTSA